MPALSCRSGVRLSGVLFPTLPVIEMVSHDFFSTGLRSATSLDGSLQDFIACEMPACEVGFASPQMMRSLTTPSSQLVRKMETLR